MITDYKNIHKGTCFILGNGPGLNDIDLDQLQDSYVFGTNRIYLSGFVPDYYVCVNDLVLSQFEEEIADLPTVKFIGNRVRFRNKLGKMISLQTDEIAPGFYSPERTMWEGYTVTYVALQLAFYMGFERVILVGVDHDYGQVDCPNKILRGGDEWHFHPDYFREKDWHAPDLRMSELAYALALKHYQEAGRKIINASTRTKLDVFPLLPFNHICGPRYRVSAMVSAYHASDYIDDCLVDLRNQSERIEIIVVCQQDSPEHEAAIEHQVDQIILTDTVIPLAEAWNLAAKAAHGKYLITANTDDRLRKDATKLMADVLDARPDIDLVYADTYINWGLAVDYAVFTDLYDDVIIGREEDKPGLYIWSDYNRSALGRGCFIGPQPMYRANLHQRYGWFDEKYISAADYDFWLRCAREKNYFHISQPLGVYLARPDSLEARTKETGIREAFEIQRKYGVVQVSVSVAGPDVRLEVGNEWGYVPRVDLKNLAVKI